MITLYVALGVQSHGMNSRQGAGFVLLISVRILPVKLLWNLGEIRKFAAQKPPKAAFAQRVTLALQSSHDGVTRSRQAGTPEL